ncbi:MAG TPA: S-layer homology domain-containing protein, partial [Clostridia bacterium]
PLQADSGRTLADFADADQVADWAREAVAALVKAGIVNGSNGRIDPLSTATRAEIAQMMQNLVKNLVRAMQEKAWIALQDRKKS